MLPASAHKEDPRRLVKTWLSVDLVRQMDAAVLASEGAYLDRTDFVAEGVRNLLDELRHEPSPTSSAPDKPAANERVERNGAAPNGAARFGDWLGGDVPTLPPARGTEESNFGLHNRDLPTLWALDRLGRLVARARRPITWEQLNAELLRAAWEEGRRLRARSLELERNDAAKAEAGFPTQTKKREAAERRFLTHFAGTSQKRGPWFVFRFVGTDGDTVAPTGAAVELVRALRGEEIDAAPPFSAGAWEIFQAYLEHHAPDELRAWMRVLEIVAGRPTRTELVSHCGWWSGSQADTNSSSYVARGREWGLIEPALDDGRYALTDRGGQAITVSKRARPG